MTRGRQGKQDIVLRPRDRQLLQEVVSQGGTDRLARIARSLAEAEPGREAVPVRTQRLYTSLYHDHLRRLVDAGLVTYSEENGEIQLTNRGRALWTDDR